MTPWRYQLFVIDGSGRTERGVLTHQGLEDELNDLGPQHANNFPGATLKLAKKQQGWELTAVTDTGDAKIFILKQPDEIIVDPWLLDLYLPGSNEGLAVKKIVFCLSLALAMPSIALSETITIDDSANAVMHGCRDALSGDTKKLAYFAGLCSGAVIAITLAGSIECVWMRKGLFGRGVDPPKGFTAEQAIRIVVKYIDARPERMDELFYGMAWEALSEAWPCKH